MPVIWERRTSDPVQAEEGQYGGLARVQSTPCYDFLFSLGALFNTRMFDAARLWARAAKRSLAAETYEQGRFFFKGNQAPGYGVARLVADLPDHAQPQELIRAVRESDPTTLVLYMLDTGETGEDAISDIRRYVEQAPGRPELEQILRGLTPDWAHRCRRVLLDPAGARSQFASLLEQYHAAVFANELGQLAEPLGHAAGHARELLSVLPTAEAIERLTGGYTLAEDLPLRRITIAPSVFIYPFMFSRVDVAAGEALIAFGVQTDVLQKSDSAPVDPQLARVIKALTDPNRQKLVHLLAQRPMFGPEVVSALGLAQPTVHHHLASLRAASLVRQERAKEGMRYTLRKDTAAQSVEALRRLFAGT
jgi:DNA-binding transcriptional ArsR family regulator